MPDRAAARPRRRPQHEIQPDAEVALPAVVGNGAMGRLLRSATAEGPLETPAGFAGQLPSAGGQPVPGHLRQDLESGLGAPLDSVRLHTGSTAAGLARQVDARAFTVGSNVYFGQGEYNPDSGAGYRLLAHEVTHTLQQGSGPQGAGPLPVSTPDSAAEREADTVAHSLAESRGTAVNAQTVSMLQRTAGNAAVARFLAREPAPAAAVPALATIADLDGALDHINVPEGRVIDILGRLGPAKIRVLSDPRYRAEIAACLNVGEMVRAVSALDAPLGRALEWVKEAAGDWSSLDYGQIATLVRAAPQAQRDALRDAGWRGRFIDICNNDTMATAVVELGFDLRTKIDWMVEEGTGKAALARVIDLAPADQLAAVNADNTLRGRIRGELSGKDFVEIDRKLRLGLYGEGDIQTEYVGNEYHVWTALSRAGLTLTRKVEYSADTGVSDALVEAIKQRVQTGIGRHLNGKWKLRVTSPGGRQPGDGDYPIRFEVVESGGGYPVLIRAGSGRATAGEDQMVIYELRANGAGGNQAIATSAHELGHGMVGAPEEYARPPGDTHDPGRKVYTDDTIMGAITEENALRLEIKDRHLTVLIPWAQRFFPGRSVTVVR